MNASVLDRRREAAARAWGLDKEIVLVYAGDLVPIAGSGDQTYPFRPHPEYRYLTDCGRPGGVLAFDPRDGWTHFVKETSREQQVWEGAAPPLAGEPLDALEAWLAARDGRPRAVLGCKDAEDEEPTEHVRDGLRTVRRSKDEVELQRMRAAAAATARGYKRARGVIRPGVTERDIRIELEAEFFRAGGERAAYDTIVGSGPNSAVLHFLPTDRVAQEGDLVLIDAGTEIEGYCADVTRTYPAGEEFTPEQRDLYAVLLEAQMAAIGRCRAGVEFKEIHLATAADLARGLVDFGLLRGDPESLVLRDAHALFFPHGLGHMVGLGVRDGASAPPRPPTERPGLKYLRLDTALEPGYTLTIEPGIYFIPALLEDKEQRERLADAVDWERVDEMLDFGGLRIEDNVHVTEGDPEILTAAVLK